MTDAKKCKSALTASEKFAALEFSQAVCRAHNLKGEVRLINQDGESYLTTEELEKVVTVGKILRKGSKLAEGACLVCINIKHEPSMRFNGWAAFRRQLSSILVKRSAFRVFRNYEKGITVEIGD